MNEVSDKYFYLPGTDAIECENLKAVYPDSEFPPLGYVSALSAMAWLVTRSDWLAGAVIEAEKVGAEKADGAFASFRWQTVEKNIRRHFPDAGGLEDGERILRRLLEAGEVDAVARPDGAQRSEQLEPYAFADWSRSYETHKGLVLVPGYSHLRVNVAKVRCAAPAIATPALSTPKQQAAAPVRARESRAGKNKVRSREISGQIHRLFETSHAYLENLTEKERAKLIGQYWKGPYEKPSCSSVARYWNKWKAARDESAASEIDHKSPHISPEISR